MEMQEGKMPRLQTRTRIAGSLLMAFPRDPVTMHTPSERAGAKMATGKANYTDTHIFPTQCGFAVFTVNICNRM